MTSKLHTLSMAAAAAGFLSLAVPSAAQAPAEPSRNAGFTVPAGDMAHPQNTNGGIYAFTGQCASCHEIRGTAARATVGPDLTHIASRRTLAGAEIPNDRTHLAAWIADPQAIKPGDRMPDLGLSAGQVSQIVSYLETLR